MKETSDLKVGESTEVIIGDKVLVIEPMPFGRLKKVLKIVFSAIDKLQSMDTKAILVSLPEIFDKNLGELISLIFDKKTHPYLDPAWVDENVSLVQLTEIVNKAIIVNGLKDFFDKMGGKTPPLTTGKAPEVMPTTGSS